MREKIRFSFFFFLRFTYQRSRVLSTFITFPREPIVMKGERGIDGRRIIGAINRSIFVLSLSFFLFSPPFSAIKLKPG